MFNIQKHLRYIVLALSLAGASLAAGAAVLPTYHIDVADTATADIAYIDFLFSSIDGAAPVRATLSHFNGGPLGDFDGAGDVSGTAGGFDIGNGGSYNDLYLAVGGPLAFDLNFSEGFLGFASPFDSSFFSIALYDSSNVLIGDPNGSLQFSLSSTGVDLVSTSSLLSLTLVPAAAAVPEPAEWMLMLTGLVFVAAMTRRNGRAPARLLAAA